MEGAVCMFFGLVCLAIRSYENLQDRQCMTLYSIWLTDSDSAIAGHGNQILSPKDDVRKLERVLETRRDMLVVARTDVPEEESLERVKV